MSGLTVLFAWLGLGAAVGLSIFDFVTSVQGIQLVMPSRDGFIPKMMPLLFASLAITFNAVSAHIFRMYLQQRFSTFASTVTFVLWVFFLGYNCTSSLLGLLHTYTERKITDFNSAVAALESLDMLAAFFVIVMSALLSAGPFLASLFSDLANSANRKPKA